MTPGGARIRPTLLLSVAIACGDDLEAAAEALATRLATEYSDDVLVAHIKNGGLKPAD